MRPLDFTRAGILGTLAVLVVAGVCVRLGFWQLDRREQRLERNAAIAERMSAGGITLIGAPADTTGITYRIADGHAPFDNDRTLVLAGRSHNGAPGVHILTPLRFRNGAVLVNRGWLPSPDAATVDLEPYAVHGEIQVDGILMPFPDANAGQRAGEFRRTWFRFDGDAIRAQFPYRVSPVYLQATRRPYDPLDADTPRALPVLLDPPTLDPGPHLSYAVQWFSFAAIAVIGWAVLLARRRDPAEDSATVDRGR